MSRCDLGAVLVTCGAVGADHDHDRRSDEQQETDEAAVIDEAQIVVMRLWEQRPENRNASGRCRADALPEEKVSPRRGRRVPQEWPCRFATLGIDRDTQEGPLRPV